MTGDGAHLVGTKTDVSPKRTLEDDFPFPQVWYVSSLDGFYWNYILKKLLELKLFKSTESKYSM